MSRRSLASAALVVAIALIAATVLARDSEPPPLEPQVKQRVREVIVAYELSKEPIVPEKLWSKRLGLRESIALLRDQKDRQQRVAIGEAARRRTARSTSGTCVGRSRASSSDGARARCPSPAAVRSRTGS